jgi:hypothetical protein
MTSESPGIFQAAMPDVMYSSKSSGSPAAKPEVLSAALSVSIAPALRMQLGTRIDSPPWYGSLRSPVPGASVPVAESPSFGVSDREGNPGIESPCQMLAAS